MKREKMLMLALQLSYWNPAVDGWISLASKLERIANLLTMRIETTIANHGDSAIHRNPALKTAPALPWRRRNLVELQNRADALRSFTNAACS
jgi:hypothetical protein